MEHTAAVHGFIAALADQACDLGWEIDQIDPSFRASRYFRHFGVRRSIHPDAFGMLRGGGRVWPFFLEWERRAVRPVTMTPGIARVRTRKQPLGSACLVSVYMFKSLRARILYKRD